MSAVSPEMKEIIRARLREISAQEDITILFAIESGSRAWGFHSPDSDYDVRFVYARPVDWHLSLAKKRDVVERPIDDELDISGWDLGKALSLTLSSNAVIGEWLQSPILYEHTEGAMAELTDFARRALTRRSVMWHYLSMVKRQSERLYDDAGQVRLKRYFYVLRPTLALRWIRLHEQAMPPMNMQELMVACDLSDDLTDEIEALTERKKSADERAITGQREPLIDRLIASETEAATAWLNIKEKPVTRGALADEATQIHIKYSKMAGE